MSKVFRITPKRVKRSNGQVVEIKEQYMRIYGFDYKKAGCSVSDFEFEKLD